MRRIKTIITASLLSVALNSFASNDLTDAFDVLISSTEPGVYSAQTRGFMTAGSFQVRFPSHSVQLISMSSPHAEGGCSGVSFFTGGMTYVDGGEFVDLLKGIAANAMGYSFQLAIKTLCPVCSTILSDIQRAAQAANKLAVNQCQFAMGLVNKAVSSVPALNQYVFGQGANSKAESGASNDFLSGVQGFSGSVEKAFDAVADGIESINDAGTKQQKYNALPLGNQTWKSLTGMTDIQKIFIQSLLGTSISGKIGSDASAETIIQPIAPSINIKELSYVFMYGAKASVTQGLMLNECDNSDVIDTGAPHDKCSPLVRHKILNSRWYSDNQGLTVGNVPLADVGFYGASYALMFQALWDVENEKELGTATQVTLPSSIYGTNLEVNASFSKAEIEAFISLAPIPLYRAINLGAVYPSISEALVNNIAGVVSSHYAVAYIEHEVLNLKDVGAEVETDSDTDANTKTSLDTTHHTAGLAGDTYIKLQQAIRSLQTHVDNQMQLVLTQLQTTAAWSNQIHEVQSLIYAQILQSGLSENFSYSLGLNGGGV